MIDDNVDVALLSLLSSVYWVRFIVWKICDCLWGVTVGLMDLRKWLIHPAFSADLRWSQFHSWNHFADKPKTFEAFIRCLFHPLISSTSTHPHTSKLHSKINITGGIIFSGWSHTYITSCQIFFKFGTTIHMDSRIKLSHIGGERPRVKVNPTNYISWSQEHCEGSSLCHVKGQDNWPSKQTFIHA